MLSADYWKSNAKKYCDFCKCWIADNKPSVEFHEKGRRHQENVAKRIKQITRNNKRIDEDNVKVDAAMAQMESAALAAYRKDVANNADLTSQAINKRLQEEDLEIAGGSDEPTGKKVWRETKSEAGQTYYWNLLTNESVWVPPKEGYLSIQEAKDKDALSSSKVWKEFHTKTVLNDRLQVQQAKAEEAEERARLAREKLKERRVEEVKAPEPAPLLEEGRTNPYGRWQTVQVIEVPPEPETVEEIPLPDVQPEVLPQRTFKEKTVESLDAAGSTQFKKRKMKGNNQRHTRARVEDD